MQTPAAAPTMRDLFDQLYREHGDRLWRSVLLATGRPEVASDAVAEAFAQAFRRSGEIRDPLAWIWRTSFRIAAGEMKESRRLVPVPNELSYEIAEPARDILDALGSLTHHQRAALSLHYYAGYTHREVAEILGSSTSAVAVHIHRAKKRLRLALEENDA